jgi:putative transposase
MRTAYLTDLFDAECSYLEPHFPAPKAAARPHFHHTREILDAIFFYVLKSGCAWRLLPHDLDGLGRPSTITSGSGVSTAPGKG